MINDSQYYRGDGKNPSSRNISSFNCFMEFYLILALIIVTMVAIFAIQNAHLVTINFLFWHFEGSLVLFLLSFFAGGLLTAILLSLGGRIKRRRAYEEKIQELKREISKTKPSEEEATAPPA